MFEAFLSNRTVSVLAEALPRILTAGLYHDHPAHAGLLLFAMIIAVAVALVQYANVPVLRQIARFYIWVIRGTPLLVQLFIIFYGLPSVGIMLDAFPAAVIAFAFNEGAYCAETMRGALESVPQGQLEAGYCVGMSWWQIMRRIDAAAGPAHRSARPLQLAHRHDQGHLAGVQYHSSRAVHGRSARGRPHLHLPAHLLWGGRGVSAVLHGHYQAAGTAGASAQRPRLPVRKECGNHVHVRDQNVHKSFFTYTKPRLQAGIFHRPGARKVTSELQVLRGVDLTVERAM